ncbi:hypothetical protein [Klebsiella aerogenes]|uniref:hypothetical protein n=1 Tax=Klebsiella aerogenes TaxID=548 RepID=UPI003C6D59CD
MFSHSIFSHAIFSHTIFSHIISSLNISHQKSGQRSYSYYYFFHNHSSLFNYHLTSTKPVITLVFPVTTRVRICHFNYPNVLWVFVSELSWDT